MDIAGFGMGIGLQLVLLLVWGYGLVKARGLTGKYAGIGRKATIAFAGFILITLIQSLGMVFLFRISSASTIALFANVVNISSLVVNVGLWLLIISAIFDERDKGADLPKEELFAN